MYSIQAFIIYYLRLILYCSVLFYLQVAETQPDQAAVREGFTVQEGVGEGNQLYHVRNLHPTSASFSILI